MGESFKLHAQSLAGYEDALLSGSGAALTSMPIQGLPSMEIAY